MTYIDGEPIEDWMKRKFEEGLRRIVGTTDLEDVKPVGKYEPISTCIVTTKDTVRYYSIDEVKEFLQTLRKLFDDFTIRPDEGKALDFAINFIEGRLNQDGLDKMIKDCERHLNCKGCPHEGECE